MTVPLPVCMAMWKTIYASVIHVSLELHATMSVQTMATVTTILVCAMLQKLVIIY